MKLKDVRETYDLYTTKTSEIVRNLGYAGIALIWVFKVDTAGMQKIPPELLTPAIFITVSLALDLSHAVIGSLIWAIYNRYREWKHTTEDQEFEAPSPINWVAIILFWSKIVAIIVAYYFIIQFLVTRVA